MTATPPAPTAYVGASSVVARSTNSSAPPRSHEMSPMAARRCASGSCAAVRRRGKAGAHPAPLRRSVRYGAIWRPWVRGEGAVG